MNNSIPGTVCCILCRGLIIYKDGDKQRFKAHLANEHGAFFDVDYLLASCFLEPAQKEAMAMSVNMVASGYIRNQSDAEVYNSNEQETLREATIAEADVEPSQMYNLTQQEASQGLGVGQGIKRERVDYLEGESSQIETDNVNQNFNLNSDGNLVGNSGKLKTKKYKKRKDPNAEEAVLNPIPEQSVPYDNYYANNTLENTSVEAMESTANESDANNEFTNSEENVKIEASEDSVKSANEKSIAGERFFCQIEGCNKSYTNPSNRHTHQKKAHGWLGKKAEAMAKKQRKSVSDANEETKQNNEETGNNEFVDNDIVNPEQQVLSKDNIVDDKIPGPDSTSQDGPISSFLTDTSLGFDEITSETNDILTTEMNDGVMSEVPELKNDDIEGSHQFEDDSVFATSEPMDDQPHDSISFGNDAIGGDDSEVGNVPGKNEVGNVLGSEGDHIPQGMEEVITQPSQPQAQAEQVDLSRSKYFEKNPKVMATARGKSLALFDKIAEDLPSGWKQRNLEVTSKTGEKSMQNHYLAPEHKVLKSALAVVEYLRMKGEDYETLIDISKKLNVPEKKFNSLYT